MPDGSGPSTSALRAGAVRSWVLRTGRRGAAMLRRTPFPRPTARGWTVLGSGIALVGGGLVATTSIAVSAGLLLLVLLVLGIVMALVVAAPLRATRSTARSVVQVGEVHRERITLRGTSLPIGPRTTLLVREQLEDALASVSDAQTYALVGPNEPPAVLDVEALAMHRAARWSAP